MTPRVSAAQLGSMDEAMLDRLPFALVVTDPYQKDNPIIFVNAAFERVTLYTRDFAVGQNCRFLQGPDTDEDTIQRIRDAVKREEEVSVDVLNYRADGTPFTNRLLIAPVHDDTGRLQSFLGVQATLRDADGGATGFSTSFDKLREIQHRVKNHLAMIVGFIRLQGRSELNEESLEALGRRVESLALLYDEMTVTSVAETEKDLVSAGAYISRIASILNSLDASQTVRVTLDCDAFPMQVDRAANLGLLLSELMTNAMRHAFEGRDDGQLIVSLKTEGKDQARLIIADNGVGLPAGSAWLDGADTKAGSAEQIEHGGDSGLGRAIVGTLLRSLRAKMTVESDTHGTRFIITFTRRVLEG